MRFPGLIRGGTGFSQRLGRWTRFCGCGRSPEAQRGFSVSVNVPLFASLRAVFDDYFTTKRLTHSAFKTSLCTSPKSGQIEAPSASLICSPVMPCAFQRSLTCATTGVDFRILCQVFLSCNGQQRLVDGMSSQYPARSFYLPAS